VSQSGIVLVSGSGFQPGSEVDLWLQDGPVLLGTVVADEDGNFTFEAVIPADATPGWTEIEAVGVDPAEPCST
jgi:hypothetical protein